MSSRMLLSIKECSFEPSEYQPKRILKLKTEKKCGSPYQEMNLPCPETSKLDFSLVCNIVPVINDIYTFVVQMLSTFLKPLWKANHTTSPHVA